MRRKYLAVELPAQSGEQPSASYNSTKQVVACTGMLLQADKLENQDAATWRTYGQKFTGKLGKMSMMSSYKSDLGC